MRFSRVKNTLLRNKYLTYFSIILLLGIVLRTILLDTVPPSLTTEEISSSYLPFLYMNGYVNLTLRAMLSYVIQGTIFSYICGPSSFSARLSAAIYGILFVVVTYKLSKEMFGQREACISLLLASITPWALIFSRFQVQSSAIAFYCTLFALLLYKGATNEHRIKKRLYYISSAIIIFAMLVLAPSKTATFVLVFSLGILMFFEKSMRRRLSYFFTGMLIMLLSIMIFFVYKFDLQYAYSYSIFAHMNNPIDFIRGFMNRIIMHFSPDFLILSGGFAYAKVEEFQELISIKGLGRYSTGTVGMLNYIGILVYPAILCLVYRIIKKKATKEELMLAFWTAAYCLTLGIAYYDNPNPARNIIGLPVLILLISLFIVRAYDILTNQRKILKVSFLIAVFLLISLSSTYFAHDYYISYPVRSASSFDYGLDQLSQFLGKNNYWTRSVYLYNLYNRDLGLAFYSENYSCAEGTKLLSKRYDFSLLNPNRSLICIRKPLEFKNGTIHCEVKLTEGYGGPSSAHINLLIDDNNYFTFSFYAKDSTYNPSGYLLMQKLNGTKYYKQSKLDEEVYYHELYDIQLDFHGTQITFYFNNKLTTTWNMSETSSYASIELMAESASVHFSDLRIDDNLLEFNNLLWNVISGTWNFDVYTVYGDGIMILIFHGINDLETFYNYKISSRLLKVIYNPDGSIGFVVISVP